MRYWKYQMILGIILMTLSILFYLIHYFIFRDAHHIFLYLIGDIAFVFIEVLLVTLIIHRVLEERDKRARLEKMNMVIGVFFTEVGTPLLAMLVQIDPRAREAAGVLVVKNEWTEREFQSAYQKILDSGYHVDLALVNWAGLGSFLLDRRAFLLTLLENPNLMEHESFTELLQAVFHLTQELGARKDLGNLPASDYKHLAGDTKRVYDPLVGQWLAHMKHLKQNYPYLFSLALRMNPFDKNASPVVRES